MRCRQKAASLAQAICDAQAALGSVVIGVRSDDAEAMRLVDPNDRNASNDDRRAGLRRLVEAAAALGLLGEFEALACVATPEGEAIKALVDAHRAGRTGPARAYMVVVQVAENDGPMSLLPVNEASGCLVDLEDGLASLITPLPSWEVGEGVQSIASRLRAALELANACARRSA